MKLVIPIANQHSYRSIPRNQDLKLKITNRCNQPSRTLVIDHTGNCFVCGCEAWLPVSVGHITDFDTLEAVWQSPTAQYLQQDINDQKFSHCAVDRCGILNHNKILNEYTIHINIDPSCNLACPSCRKDSIMVTSGDVYQRRLAEVEHVVALLERFDQPTRIVMSGNGDPLASAIMRPLIEKFQPRDNQRIRLFTNGLLLEKQLADSTILNSIDHFMLSIDAGSEQVYENVRRPGKFNVLLRNLAWLKTLNCRVSLNFVLQQANWHDLENFVQLAKQFSYWPNITRLEDWDTWTGFADQDVIGNPEHPDHLLAVQELRRVHALHPRVGWGASLPTTI
jgi:organic radical activating enzyme